MRPLLRAASAAPVLLALACGPSAPEPAPPPPPSASAPAAIAAPAPPPDEPPPVLRTASPPVEDRGATQGRVVARFDDAGIETIEIAFTPPVPRTRDEWALPVTYEVAPEAGAPLSFVARAWGDGGPPGELRERRVWLRRRAAGGPVRVAVLAHDEEGGYRFTVEAPAPSGAADPRARAAFGQALEDHLRGALSATPFDESAARRIERAYRGGSGPAAGRAPGAPRPIEPLPELSGLMRATTGVSALRAALAHERPLASGPSGRATVAIASVTPPRMETHPWAAMSKALGAAVPVEPLLAFAPADAWFVRARSLSSLFRLLDEADAWGTAAVRLAEDVAFDAELAARYETQLGLRRSALARVFGDEVVGEVALVGGDPYLREGSDVSLLFRVKARAPFEIALADALADRAAPHGPLATTKVRHEGVDVSIASTSGGAVRRHRATIGDVEIVSNSLGAVRRIIDAAKGKAAPLSGEADVAYALARDAGEPADVLLLVGERFVRKIVGPAHKIGEARRQLARARLLGPGTAAVLFGWLRGVAPRSTDDLVQAKLLDRGELSLDDRSPVTFEPGSAPVSSWGTPGFLTPLVDLPEISKVSPVERDAYAAFRQAYEGGWAGEPFDPIAVRVALPSAGPLAAHVRVLPIPADRDVEELLRVVGDARVRAEPVAGGARLVVGLSAEERWRRELGLDLGRLVGGDRKVLDWIGDWLAFGVADRNGLLHAAREDVAPEPPAPRDPDRRRGDEELAALSKLPVWMGVQVRSAATLGVLLTVIRKLADDAIPGLVSWGEVGREGAVPIVRVTIAGEALSSKEADAVSIHYAIAPAGPGASGSALYVSPREEILREVLVAHAAGRGPTAAPGPRDAAAAQAVAEVAASAGGPLATLLVWAAERSAREQSSHSRAYAEWFLRSGVTGTEHAALARAYLGAAPTTPSGRPYELGPTGVLDPERGSEIAPRWPAVPVPGTPIAAVAERLARVRVETAFDEEPASTRAAPLRSFRARVVVQPR